MYKNLFIILLLIPVSGFASLTQVDLDESFLQYNVVEKNSNETLMSVSFSQPHLVNSESNNSVYYSYGISDVSEPGMPIVPSVARFIRIPLNGGVHIEVESVHFRTEILDNYSVMDGSNLDAIESDNISDDGFYPRNITEIGDPAILREFRVASVKMNPVQVNLETGEVRIYDRVDFRVVRDESSTENELIEQPLRISQTYLPIYEQFLDWQLDELDDFEVYNGGIIVVLPEGTVRDSIQPWIQWKKQLGFNVQIVTPNSNASGICNTLRNIWELRENKFDFVVLVGDFNGEIECTACDFWVSSHQFADQTFSDFGYSLMEGNDELSDVIVGRISVRSVEELGMYIRKVMQYEKNPPLNNPGFFNRAQVGGHSSIHYGLERGGYTVIDSIGFFNDSFIDLINDGVNLCFYSAYYNWMNGNESIPQFRNYEEHPIITFFNGDQQEWWDLDYSLSEQLMRAEYEGNPTGALAVLTSSSYYWDDDVDFSCYRLLVSSAANAVSSGSNPLGLMIQNARVNLHRENLFNSWEYEFLKYKMMLFGDPTIKIWHDVPDTLVVEAPDTMNIGSDNLSVSVFKDGNPVEGATVTLYKYEQYEEKLASINTDVSGNGTLIFSAYEEGEASLVVSLPEHVPFSKQIYFENAGEIAVTDFSIYDDGRGETEGNGNGVIEYGETIALVGRIHNYAETTYRDINISVESYGTFIDTAWGLATEDSLQSGSSRYLDEYIYLRIKQTTPDQWNEFVNLTIETEDGTTCCPVEFSVNSPNYVVVPDTTWVGVGIAGLVPFQIYNKGFGGGNNSTLRLESNDDWLTVVTASGTLEATACGDTNTTSSFVVSIAEEAFDGYQASATLSIIDADTIAVLPVKVNIGKKNRFSPEGPDYYGYYAFDCVDENILAPTYHWIEIYPENPDCDYSGTQLPVTNNPYCLNLPFELKFYGQVHSQISVSKNGWVAMDDQCDYDWDDDYHIPSPLGPYGMIAPKMNNLTSASVFSYYDEDGQRFIIQWQGVSFTNEEEFQLVIFNNDNVNNDNDLLFQYKNAGTRSAVGIENHNQTDGFALRNKYDWSSGTYPSENESSILITKQKTALSGNVHGVVALSLDESPMEGVIVESLSGGYRDTTDTEGHYSIEAQCGQTRIIARMEGYPDSYSGLITLNEGATIEQNLLLNTAIPEIDPEEVEFLITSEELCSQSFNITNNGDVNLEVSLESTIVHPDSNSLGELGDHAFYYRFDSALGLCQQIGDTLLFLKSDDDIQLYIELYTLDGDLITTYPLVDIVYDDVKGMKIIESDILIMTQDYIRYYTLTESGIVSDHNMQLPDIDAISEFAVSLADEEIYFFSGRNLYIYSLTSNTIVDTTDIRIDDHPTGDYEDAYYCAVLVDQEDSTIYLLLDCYSVGPGGQTWYGNNIYSLNKSTGGRSYLFGMSYVSFSDFELFDFNNGTIKRFGFYKYSRNTIDVREFEYESDWISVNRNNLIIPSGTSHESLITINGSHLRDGITKAWAVISNNSPVSEIIVPVTIYKNISDVELKYEVIPTEWALRKIYPNPFNPTTNVEFALVENADVKVKLFNVMGQEVALVLDQKMNAGYHRVTVDGTSLASGVYFLEFEAGPIRDVRKIVLLK